ncbi:glycosyltransferase family 39 protein [Sinorhizobium meliloti]|uniref:ArnT family glycosyltransferase n=1 Tax=Rhizobium meliloti TaxID=382 RepID=UPI000FDAB596|nr:glycosyltransferase family 39 protein [Sinorhizobium meliloti]MDW9407084.1 glycosyltransferase family 39 protein [Sinorhizobium meliloti]MDW9452184.1 glycosyltransferase family 39 protein [Sinorhizobium meliloti]MDW9465196.1 glycosyltransferase family 39 protein [Sinorhizobium meliloti]MDW9557752.1 glycosyltransferase family 39 protein [Sinorhizobium meliloti]MDW9596819.1 glycosyltransferase family 39 protein [Sinorhizobium meliloti]
MKPAAAERCGWLSVVHRRASGNFRELRLLALSLARDSATNAGEGNGGRMRSLLVRRPDLLYVLIAGYCLLSIILKVLRPDSLEIDESEQALLSQYLLLGYGAQPPFYNWLQYGVVALFGISVASLAIVKNGLLFLFLLFYGLTARLLSSSRLVPAVAVLGVLTLPPVFLLSQRDLSHTVAALFAVSLFLYGFFRALKSPPKVGHYLLVGVAVGLGAISKYNFVILPVAALLAILPEAKLRKYLFDWRVLASVAVCAMIVAPHAYWIVNNLGHATGVTVAEMKEGADSARLPHAIQGLVSLAVAALKGVALTLAVFGLLFYADVGRILRAESLGTRVIGRMIVACFLIIAFIVVAMDATHIRAKWLALFTALLPLYLTLKIDAADLDPARRLPALFSISGILSVGVIVMLWARVFVGPMIGDYSFAHTPYNGFASTVRADPGPPPVAIVVDDRIVAGNLRIQFPDTPIILTGFSKEAEKHLPPGRILAAWSAEGKGREEVPPRITGLLQLMPVRIADAKPTIVSVPYNAGRPGDTYTFAYIWADFH